MSEDQLAGLWTLIAMIAFLGVCFWAYSSKRRGDFEEAANLPFADGEGQDSAEAASQTNLQSNTQSNSKQGRDS